MPLGVNGRAFRKLAARISRVTRRPTPAHVRRLTLAVSWRCDCKCQMCGIWKIYVENPALQRAELTTDETVSLLANASALRRLETIVFTGGEPFIHRQFVPLALALERRFPRVHMDITTTGQATSLIRQKLDAIAEGGGRLSRYHVCVSLDGVGETHDEVRGKVGAYKRAIETIEALRPLPIGKAAIGFTILPSNVHSLGAAYRLAVDLGVHFTMRVAHFNEGIYANATDGERHRWTPEALAELETIVRAIMADKQRRRGLLESCVASDVYFAEQMLAYVKAPRRLMPCYSGTHSAVIDPFGAVSPCVNLDMNIGSARERGFDAVWFSDAATAVRAHIAAERCHCWTECESDLSLQTAPAYLLYNLKSLVFGRAAARAAARELP